MRALNIFHQRILAGIPDQLPLLKPYDLEINHAPKRKDILTKEEKKLALKNALRYFPVKFHQKLAPEFYSELVKFGRIYMYRFRPGYKIYARPIHEYPHQSTQAAAIMLMIDNNLDERLAQHPHELITYGGNGAVFQNWAQYRLTMKYLATMTDKQTLILYSGHPLGLFPSNQNSPRMVITNGLMVPNYSKPDDWEKYNALGVTQYGQMTAGSFMYIGPQGIVHGTTITILNAARRRGFKDLRGKIFVSSGLGGMSGAQAKASVITGAVGVIAEINPKAVEKRFAQGWVDEVYPDLSKLIRRVKAASKLKEVVSIAYQGNIVDLWKRIVEEQLIVELGSDQTSLHNPFAGGYYPSGLSLEESNELMVKNPTKFKAEVYKSLREQVVVINAMSQRGMYFWDYGNAFLLEAGRAGADVFRKNGEYKYPSYVEDIVGPMCFDYGFGPFRWVCASGDPKDLETTDKIAIAVLSDLLSKAPKEIKQQLEDNLKWVKDAGTNKLVVGSQARILYTDAKGRIQIASAFNEAVRTGKLRAPVVLGRDHHDVSGTDSPFRETANIYDGSKFTADMSAQNVIGDAFRGATWVSLHNGGGVGWGEVINGGFGMVLDGSKAADERLKSMLFWDVNNGLARRSWAGNEGAVWAIGEAMKEEGQLTVTKASQVRDETLDGVVQ